MRQVSGLVKGLSFGLVLIGWLVHHNVLSAQQPQKLAPGVLKVIEPEIDARDTHTLPMSTPGISAPEFDPNQSSVTNTLAYQSRRIVMFRNVWQYEFSFLPLRQIQLDVATGDGTTVKRVFWYLIFQVRNTGAVLVNEEIRDPKFNTLEYEKRANFEQMADDRKQALIEKMSRETLFTRFIGNFRMEGWVENINTGEYARVNYRPIVDLNVVQAIQQKEDPATPLLTTAQIMKKSLPIVSPKSKFGGVWGCVVWENIDPRIDFVSVFVNGLTNAYRLEPAGDDWKTVNKTLQLNFWRPGDAVGQDEDKIVYGIPYTEDYRRQVQICDRYNLPGPVLNGFDVDPETTRRRQIIEIDGQVSLRTLQSALASELNKGTIPNEVKSAFESAGYPIPDGASVQTTIRGKQWTIDAEINGEKKSILLDLKAQFWEPAANGESIDFTESLDHLWIYE